MLLELLHCLLCRLLCCLLYCLPAVLLYGGTEKAMQLQRCAEGERARGVGQTGLTFCAAWRTWSEKRSSVAAWSASGSATPVLIMNPWGPPYSL